MTNKNSSMIEALNWRYATKKFDTSKKVSDADLNELLESLRLSASSFGIQPWKFFVVESPQTRAKIKEAAWNQPQVTDASHLIVLCAKTGVDEAYIRSFARLTEKTRSLTEGALKDLEDTILGFIKKGSKEFVSEWAKRQVYIALGTLLSTAAIKRIDACPMEGFDPKKVDEILNLEKEGLTSVAFCTIGYRAQDDKYASIKKIRFEAKDVIKRI